MSDQIASPPPLSPTATLDDIRSYLQLLDEWWRAREPLAVGSSLSKFVTNEAMVALGLAAYVPGLPTGVGDGYTSGVGSGETDLTPPPDAVGLTGVSLFAGAFLQWTAPTYTQGGGNAYTEIYAANYSGTGPLPTFANAVLVGTASGASNVYVDAAELGAERHYWIKFVSRANVRQDDPTGGINGLTITIGKIGNTDLGNLIVSAEKLSQGTYPNINLVPNPGSEDGAVAWSTAWDTGLGTFTVDTANKTGGAQAFKLTKVNGTRAGVGCLAFPVIPGETYAWRLKWKGSTATGGSHYVRMYEAATKPVGGYVTGGGAASVTDLVSSGPITTAFVEVKGPYQVPAGVFWVSLGVLNDIASANLDLWWDDVSVGRQITAEFLAANSIAVGTLAVQNGAIVNAMIGTLAVTDANIASMSAAKLTAGSISVGEYIQSTGYNPGIDGFRITGSGSVDINNLVARGSVQSPNYVAGSVGWAIKSNDTAEFEALSIRGAIRGLAHLTIGSYLTSAAAAAAGTLNLADTIGFPASGTAVIADTTNDRDVITYTGKTATTLTGCAGVLAHNNGATIIPLAKAMVIDAATNEMRFFGDRGDGTIEEMASVGIVPSGADTAAIVGGSQNSSRIGVIGLSNTSHGVQGSSGSGVGVRGTSFSGTGVEGTSTDASNPGVAGFNSSGGPAVYAGAAGSGNSIEAESGGGTGFGVKVTANSTKGHEYLVPLTGRPSNKTAGAMAMIYTTGGVADARTATPRLMVADGTDWRRVADDTIFTG